MLKSFNFDILASLTTYNITVHSGYMRGGLYTFDLSAYRNLIDEDDVDDDELKVVVELIVGFITPKKEFDLDEIYNEILWEMGGIPFKYNILEKMYMISTHHKDSCFIGWCNDYGVMQRLIIEEEEDED